MDQSLLQNARQSNRLKFKKSRDLKYLRKSITLKIPECFVNTQNFLKNLFFVETLLNNFLTIARLFIELESQRRLIFQLESLTFLFLLKIVRGFVIQIFSNDCSMKNNLNKEAKGEKKFLQLIFKSSSSLLKLKP